MTLTNCYENNKEEKYLQEIEILLKKVKKENEKQIKIYLDEKYLDKFKDFIINFCYTYYYLNDIKNIFNNIPNSITDIIFTHSKTLLNFKFAREFDLLKNNYVVHNLTNKLKNIENITFGMITLNFDFLPSSLLSVEESITGYNNDIKKKTVKCNLPNKILFVKFSHRYLKFSLSKNNNKNKKYPLSLKYIDYKLLK